MAWSQLWIDKPHLAYALIGGFVSVFSLISLFVKEKMYIGEATVATIFGLIIGPHCLKWFVPTTWGNSDYITIEVSRIVLVVQIFAVAVELPKKYMLKHWLSVTILLLPVMTFGWLISSVFIWKLIPTLSWVEGLALAACVTATDPVLASAVVGKGKFARRVPGHLRNLLSAESGCNDGMAFPFAYLALSLIKYKGHHGEIAFHFIVITILYECIFGCILGAVIGYCGRHLIKFAESKNLIDRESFLVFYFVLALFCTGVGTVIGVDDLLVSFAAGTAFAWDGWFARKTEESHVSNVIDLLLNMAYFVYFGAIIPWEQFNAGDIGLSAWKLVLLAIIILVIRRLPIMLLMKPITPDIRNWREAFFCGHFGPIGVGAVFIAILSRAELEHGEPTPLAHLPEKGSKNYYAVATIWPVTTFLVIASIVVHGSSIAVFTLGKRLNNMTLTMTYTQNTNASSSWLQRLPPIGSGRSFSFSKSDTKKKGPKARPAGGMKKRKRSRRVDTDHVPESEPIDLGTKESREVEVDSGNSTAAPGINGDIAAYQEGDDIIIESPEGNVLAQINSRKDDEEAKLELPPVDNMAASSSSTEVSTEQSSASGGRSEERTERRRRGGTRYTAYQLDDDVIVENEDGEVVKRYKINKKKTPANEEKTSFQNDAESSTKPSIMDKTLSLMGLRKTSSNTETRPPKLAHSATTHTVDIQDNPDTRRLVRREGTTIDANMFDDEKVKRHLKKLFSNKPPSAEKTEIKKTKEEPEEDMSEEEEEEEDIENETSTADAGTDKNDQQRHNILESAEAIRSRPFLGQQSEPDEGDDVAGDEALDTDETPAERRRRLAALGLLEEDEDNADEEDEEPGHVSRSNAENGNDDKEPKIHFAVKR